MKKHLSPLLAGVLLAGWFAGCETDGGITARTKEKPAAYAKLPYWQKTFIEKGVIANGFTPDMVYMAMGHPNKVEAGNSSQGPAELWTYSQYYPNVDAVHGFRYASFSRESAYQPQYKTFQNDGMDSEGHIILGEPRGMGLTPETIFKTGPAQGGSMEVADLRSYTIEVLFQNGKVVRLAAQENLN